MQIGILGLGEVGHSLKKLVKKKHQVFVRDFGKDELKGQKVDILHVCIPYVSAKQFFPPVKQAIKDTNPKLIIINSTVKPGTTQTLAQQTKRDFVHAPIMGKHPHLYQYFFRFRKPLGATSEKASRLAKKHFEDLGVKVEKFDSPLETELAKILSTTYYGWIIIFEKYIFQLCQQEKASFRQVYTRFNQIYNQGYQKTLPHVTRPILKHQPGPIGGHCVIPNAQIIHHWLRDEVSNFLLKYNQSLLSKKPKRKKGQ